MNWVLEAEGGIQAKVGTRVEPSRQRRQPRQKAGRLEGWKVRYWQVGGIAHMYLAGVGRGSVEDEG